MPGFTRKTTVLIFALVVGSLLASSLLQRYLGHVMDEPNLDFYDYYFAAQVVRDTPRADLYYGATTGNPQLRSAPRESELAGHARAAGFADTELYLYPPLLANLLVPLSVLPPRIAAELWRIFNLALVVLSAMLLARKLGLRVLSSEFFLVLAAAFAFWPIHEAISLGQVSIGMLALWTVGILAYFEGKVVLSAVALAIATGIKVTPIAVVPLFFIWKDAKWLASYLATAAGLVCIMLAVNGWNNLRGCMRVMGGMTQAVPAIQNKSIGALLSWIYYGRVFRLDQVQAILVAPSPRGLMVMCKACSVLVYASCLFLVWMRRSDVSRAWRATTIAVFAVVSATVSPVSWRHGYTVALPLLAIVWMQVLRDQESKVRCLPVAGATLTIGSLCFDLAAQGPFPQAAKIVFAGLWTVSAILLCVYVLSKSHSGAGAVGSRDLPFQTVVDIPA